MAAFARHRPGGRKKEGSTVHPTVNSHSGQLTDKDYHLLLPTYMPHQQTQKKKKKPIRALNLTPNEPTSFVDCFVYLSPTFTWHLQRYRLGIGSSLVIRKSSMTHPYRNQLTPHAGPYFKITIPEPQASWYMTKGIYSGCEKGLRIEYLQSIRGGDLLNVLLRPSTQ